MFRAAMVIESQTMGVTEISAVMGTSPDSADDKGAINKNRSERRQWTTWRMELTWPADLHAGTEGINVALMGLGRSIADRVALLVGRGCTAVISIWQELSGDPATTGIHLTPGAILWIANAGASVDIDQYT